ncbi:hypothetical protein DUI87_30745 [Hirundo rustica rustica]|uniref:Uncharacterized protein n=1 Tax=Hirundo rustica rustica TaxID=333673 RepID=A0A3M0IU03_HIRRU|nr:hypothetical protein DUI87_30745 [Hirundo rustica rustica]
MWFCWSRDIPVEGSSSGVTGPIFWEIQWEKNSYPAGLNLSFYPVSKHPLVEKPFPDIQPKPPLAQLQAIPLGPVTGHQREEVSVSPSPSPFMDWCARNGDHIMNVIKNK